MSFTAPSEQLRVATIVGEYDWEDFTREFLPAAADIHDAERFIDHLKSAITGMGLSVDDFKYQLNVEARSDELPEQDDPYQVGRLTLHLVAVPPTRQDQPHWNRWFYFPIGDMEDDSVMFDAAKVESEEITPTVSSIKTPSDLERKPEARKELTFHPVAGWVKLVIGKPAMNYDDLTQTLEAAYLSEELYEQFKIDLNDALVEEWPVMDTDARLFSLRLADSDTDQMGKLILAYHSQRLNAHQSHNVLQMSVPLSWREGDDFPTIEQAFLLDSQIEYTGTLIDHALQAKCVEVHRAGVGQDQREIEETLLRILGDQEAVDEIVMRLKQKNLLNVITRVEVRLNGEVKRDEEGLVMPRQEFVLTFNYNYNNAVASQNTVWEYDADSVSFDHMLGALADHKLVLYNDVIQRVIEGNVRTQMQAHSQEQSPASPRQEAFSLNTGMKGITSEPGGYSVELQNALDAKTAGLAGLTSMPTTSAAEIRSEIAGTAEHAMKYGEQHQPHSRWAPPEAKESSDTAHVSVAAPEGFYSHPSAEGVAEQVKKAQATASKAGRQSEQESADFTAMAMAAYPTQVNVSIDTFAPFTALPMLAGFVPAENTPFSSSITQRLEAMINESIRQAGQSVPYRITLKGELGRAQAPLNRLTLTLSRETKMTYEIKMTLAMESVFEW